MKSFHPDIIPNSDYHGEFVFALVEMKQPVIALYLLEEDYALA
jgi:hypothetical protein